MSTPTERLTALEIRSAEQERTIEELSGQVAEQWGVIERLRKALDRLDERFRAIEDNSGTDVPVTKPPHY